MEHYQHLVLKGLINGGGSSSESYVYTLLTGNFSDNDSSVSRMWSYLDTPLQEYLIEVFADVCRLDLSNMTDSQIVRELIDYMADKAGRSEFFATTDRSIIDRMSDDEYEAAINKLINTKKVMLLDKE